MLKKQSIIAFALLLMMMYGAFAQGEVTDSSVLSSGRWYSVSISSDGVYKLTYSDFIAMGADAAEIDWDNLSVYGNTGHQLSEIVANNKYNDLAENAIYVDKSSGYALFYAESTTSRSYNTTTQKFSPSLHPYDTKTKYFITFDKNIGTKRRISPKIDIMPEVADTVITSAKDFYFHKREIKNLFSAGRDWVGEEFLSTSNVLQVPISTPMIEGEENAYIDVCFANTSSRASSYTISLGNTTLSTLDFESNPPSAVAIEKTVNISTQIGSASNTLTISFNHEESSAKGWLESVIVNYTKKLQAGSTFTRWFLTNKNYEHSYKYNISSVNGSYMLWDVTDPINVQSLASEQNGTNVSFFDNADTIRTVVILKGTSFPSPTLGTIIENQNLHGIDSADLVIISYEGFISWADSLAEIHRMYDSLAVAVVPLEKIFNEFSSGTRDFMAIREFVRTMYKNSNGTKPENVLLFGDGTFDNKNILLKNNNFIPTFQSKTNPTADDAGITDDDAIAMIADNSKNLTSDSILVGVGRLPVNNEEQARIMVNKSLRYLRKNDLLSGENGDWRNDVMLTSDDADNRAELYFIHNAENIYYQIDETQPGLNVQKVYEDAYKEYTSSSGATYPDASNAINERMKKGCLLFNYLGHGSEDHLSGERLITITDITSWNNYNKLCLMITSTCEFNRFDLTERQAAGEYILTSENGAGIGLIAAARKISSNDPINRALHKYALQRGDDGRAMTFGQVVRRAKNSVNLMYSERSISLIGDPALRISLPKYNVHTLSINDVMIDSLNMPLSNLDTITALSTVIITGQIEDFKGRKIDNFNGKILINLYDKKSTYYTLNNSNVEDGRLKFEQQSNLLHKGWTEVKNGEFIYKFTLPKDISYNYGRGKLSYYAQGEGNEDASGYCKEFVIGGIDTNVVPGEMRPSVRLFLNDTNFVSGGISDENPSLYAVIYDSIPINTVGTGLGHDIVARLDNAANTFILNDYYVEDTLEGNRGCITYPLHGLSEGEHTLSIKVWNIHNYSTSATITFNVINSKEDKYIILNYPNPFKDVTSIEIRYNQPKDIQKATLQIISSTGALVLEKDISDKIGTYTVGPIEWKGDNMNGSRLPGGMYFCNIILETSSGEEIIRGNKMILQRSR